MPIEFRFPEEWIGTPVYSTMARETLLIARINLQKICYERKVGLPAAGRPHTCPLVVNPIPAQLPPVY